MSPTRRLPAGAVSGAGGDRKPENGISGPAEWDTVTEAAPPPDLQEAPWPGLPAEPGRGRPVKASACAAAFEPATQFPGPVRDVPGATARDREEARGQSVAATPVPALEAPSARTAPDGGHHPGDTEGPGRAESRACPCPGRPAPSAATLLLAAPHRPAPVDDKCQRTPVPPGASPVRVRKHHPALTTAAGGPARGQAAVRVMRVLEPARGPAALCHRPGWQPCGGLMRSEVSGGGVRAIPAAHNTDSRWGHLRGRCYLCAQALPPDELITAHGGVDCRPPGPSAHCWASAPRREGRLRVGPMHLQGTCHVLPGVMASLGASGPRLGGRRIAEVPLAPPPCLSR